MINNKKIIIILGILVLLGLSFYLLTNLKTKPTEVSQFANVDITIQTFQENGAWGYDILIDGTLYIHQSNIPAVAGDKGFKTEIDAQRMAEFVVHKIRNNILPPTVSIEEIQNLGIHTN